MTPRRTERLNEQLKREIATILLAELKDPRIGAPVVTAVETSPDLTLAKVFVSEPAADEPQLRETLEGLRAASGFIRGTLGKRLHIRRVPELRFEADRSLEQGMRIERLLEEARRDERPDEA